MDQQMVTELDCAIAHCENVHKQNVQNVVHLLKMKTFLQNGQWPQTVNLPPVYITPPGAGTTSAPVAFSQNPIIPNSSIQGQQPGQPQFQQPKVVEVPQTGDPEIY